MAATDPPPRPGKPPLPWRARLLAGAVSALHAACLRSDGSVNRFLLSLFDRAVPLTPTPVDGVASSDHAVFDHLRVRLFTPTTSGYDGSKQLPVVVYFHGGGFVFHSAATAQYDAMCRRLASAVPSVVASVDYRLAPEHRFPVPYDDGEAALRWVLAGAGGTLPSPPAAVFVAGDSAGGNVAHHVAARLPYNVAGLVTVQPFFGGDAPTASERRLRNAPFGAPERLAWLWRAFLPPGATRDHEAANVPATIRARRRRGRGAVARVPAHHGVRRGVGRAPGQAEGVRGRAPCRRRRGGPRGGVPGRHPRVLHVRGARGQQEVGGRRRGVREPANRAPEEKRMSRVEDLGTEKCALAHAHH